MVDTQAVVEAANTTEGPVITFAEKHASALDGIASLFGILFAYLPIPAVEKDVALGVLTDIRNFVDEAKAQAVVQPTVLAAPAPAALTASDPDTRFLGGTSETTQQQQTEGGV